jgi:hypothetical protein
MNLPQVLTIRGRQICFTLNVLNLGWNLDRELSGEAELE